MGYSLKQQGLLSYNERSLVFVRLLESDDGQRLVLVLAPSDNPGVSPINGAESLIPELQAAFGAHRALVAFPQFERDEWIELQVFDGTTEPVRLTQAQLAEQAGPYATLPPATACRCEDLAPGDVLLALVPEPEPERCPADDLQIVAVSELPWPHHPFRCAHAERFDELAQLYPPAARDTGAVGAHWQTTLTTADYTECRYHQPDWKAAAAAAVQIARAEIPTTLEELAAAISSLDLPDETAEAALSLFTDPVIWTPGATHVTNGQHRVCALRASGAPRTVVDTAGRPVP